MTFCEEVRAIRRPIVVTALILLFLCLLAGCSPGEKTGGPKASKGVLDLRTGSFPGKGAESLSGEWIFYNNRLLSPMQAEKEPGGRLVEVPNSWNNDPDEFGIRGGQGFGTYKLTVLIKPADNALALRVPNIYSAYKLWVNGKLLASEGQVGQNRSSSRAEQFPRIVSFDGKTDRLELVVQVSNFQHRKGGIWVDFKLGDSDRLVGEQMKSTAEDMMILGSLFIVGIYHIGLYAFRRQERFTIHFGVLCLLVAARNGVTGDAYLLQIMKLSWEPALKLEYIAFTLSALAGFMYVYRLFPLETSERVKKAVIGIGLTFCSVVLAFPGIVYSRMLPLYQLFVLAVGLYLLGVLIAARIRKREGSSFVLAGVAVFVITILNDMLFFNEWFGSTQLVPLGLFFFILMQAFIISSRFSNALNRVELVSCELRELNAHLEERIEERTETLRRTNETLERANTELGKMATSRRHLMSNISHDLRTPITLLQGYLEAMQDGVVETGEQQRKYIKMMLGKVGGLNRLIGDLFELSKLEAGQLTLDLMPITLAKWMERLADHYEIDVRSAGLSFGSAFLDGSGENMATARPQAVLLRLDLARMDQVIANIIYNAVKHTQAGGRIALSLAYERLNGMVVIRVNDTGSGIEAEHLPFIFDRFYKKDISRNSAHGGSGLGLAIAKEIVEAHGGEIGAESVPGEGTSVWVSLPASE